MSVLRKETTKHPRTGATQGCESATHWLSSSGRRLRAQLLAACGLARARVLAAGPDEHTGLLDAAVDAPHLRRDVVLHALEELKERLEAAVEAELALTGV